MSPDTASITLARTPLAGASRHGFVIGLAGWSGSGKTTLAEQLIGALTARGRDVATIKHAHHQVDADVQGKDSHRERTAGARFFFSAQGVFFHERRIEQQSYIYILYMYT